MLGLMPTGHHVASKQRMWAEVGHRCHQSREPMGSSHLCLPAHLGLQVPTPWPTTTLTHTYARAHLHTPCTWTAHVCKQAHAHSWHTHWDLNKMNTLKCSFLNTSEVHIHSSLLLSFDGFQNKKVYKVANGEWLLDHGTFWSYSTNIIRCER